MNHQYQQQTGVNYNGNMSGPTRMGAMSRVGASEGLMQPQQWNGANNAMHTHPHHQQHHQQHMINSGGNANHHDVGIKGQQQQIYSNGIVNADTNNLIGARAGTRGGRAGGVVGVNGPAYHNQMSSGQTSQQSQASFVGNGNVSNNKRSPAYGLNNNSTAAQQQFTSMPPNVVVGDVGSGVVNSMQSSYGPNNAISHYNSTNNQVSVRLFDCFFPISLPLFEVSAYMHSSSSVKTMLIN